MAKYKVTVKRKGKKNMHIEDYPSSIGTGMFLADSEKRDGAYKTRLHKEPTATGYRFKKLTAYHDDSTVTYELQHKNKVGSKNYGRYYKKGSRVGNAKAKKKVKKV